ncbi:MAG: DUF5518 domain-containing protein [Haloarculaceae archaeon]
MAAGDTWTNAVIGAVVTVVTSFTGFSPIIGGAVAGYLNQRDGVSVGALSGLLAGIPLLGFLFLFGSLFAFLPMMGPRAGVAGAFGLVAILFAIGFLVVWGAALGAIGGWLGEYLYTEDVL